MVLFVWKATAARAAIVALAALAGAGGFGVVSAQGEGEAIVEVRVWQGVGDARDIHVSARPAGGSWDTLGTIPLPLDDGVSSSGRYRFGDIALDVPLSNRASPATVELRVWQDIGNSRNIHISARAAGGDWRALGTIPLPLDDGLSDNGRFRYGDIALDVPLPDTSVATLPDLPKMPDYRWYPWFTGTQVGLLRYGLDFDHDGSLIVADSANRVIRRIMPDGSVTTVAGGSGAGVRDGPADVAQFAWPSDVAIAGDGSIYVADSGASRIRKIAPDGVVTTVAGDGSRGYGDGPAAEASFTSPHGIVVNDSGDIYVLEVMEGRTGRIMRISSAGLVSTVVGVSEPGDPIYRDGPVAQARLWKMIAMDINDEGKLYVLEESGYDRLGVVFNVRVIDPEGEVSTLFRGETPGLGGALAYPRGLAVGSDGTVYLANTFHHQVLALTPDGELVAVAGTGKQGYLDGDHEDAAFSLPTAIAVSEDGTIVVGDEGNSVIRRIAAGADSGGAGALAVVRGVVPPYLPGVGDVTVFAGSRGPTHGELVDGPADQAKFLGPRGGALDHAGNMLVADTAHHAIRSVAPDGTVTTLAGGNGRGFRDGPCASAQFAHPLALAVSAGGDIYVADWLNYRIRRITPDCQVTTVAGGASDGGAQSGYRDGSGDLARFSELRGIAFDGMGNLLILDTGNHALRRLSPTGEVSTFAGGKQGDPFTHPQAIAVDDEGNVFVVQRDAVFAIDAAGDVTTTLLLPPLPGLGGLLSNPEGIAVAADGALFVTESYFGRVLRITRDGMVSVVAGVTESNWSGGSTLGGPASEAHLFAPRGIVVAENGDLLVVAGGVNLIWKITFEDGN